MEKKAKVRKQVSTRTTDGDHLKDIHRYLDQVLAEAVEMRVLHERGDNADLNPHVNRIMELVGNIRFSVHHSAPPLSLSIPALPAPPVSGDGGNEARNEDASPAPAPGDGQAHESWPPAP